VKFILTNDDGIEAPGIAALYECLNGKGAVVVVAPRTIQSGVGHRVTTSKSLSIVEFGPDRLAVDGTPADCARIAIKQIAPDADWLIAGINAGSNLGIDAYQSGTVAAAREAAILGRPAIAISQYIAENQTINWPITQHHADTVLKMLIKDGLPSGYFWNVNLPHPLSYETSLTYECGNLDPNPHAYTFEKAADGLKFTGNIHQRPRDPGKDVDICFSGKVSLTRIALTTIGLAEIPPKFKVKGSFGS
jgi:5'-nucleotidase